MKTKSFTRKKTGSERASIENDVQYNTTDIFQNKDLNGEQKKNTSILGLFSKMIFVFFLFLSSLVSTRFFGQSGTLSGTGHDCKNYGFAICPGQVITPLNYQTYNFSGCGIASTLDVSFVFPGSGWRVDRTTWSFIATVSGLVSGFSPGGSPQSFSFSAGQTIAPLSYPGTNGVIFGINGTPQTYTFNLNTFSITINSVTFGSNSYTYCTNTATSVVISPTVPLTGGPWTYTWQPGGGTGNPITVSPTVNTIYTVSILPTGTTPSLCTVTKTIAVTVATCACCIGNPCSMNTNPLPSDWDIPMNNKNYIFRNNSVTPNGKVGIGNITGCLPGNLLEVNKAMGPTFISGLRLTDLAFGAAATPTNNKVLSVDNSTGDVILTTVTGGSGPGGTCPSTNNLTGDYEIPLNNFNFHFTTPVSSTGGQVIIGQAPIPTCPSMSARLSVTDDILSKGIFGFCSTASGNNIGIHGQGLDANTGTSIASIGVMGETDGFPTTASVMPTSVYAGVAGFCGTPNYGTMPIGQAIGVYGNSTANSGIWAGYFDGNVMINGSGFLTGFVPISSDRRFKKNITELENISEKIAKIKSYTYEFRLDEFKGRNFAKGEQLGFIAQELKEVFPQLVVEGKDGYNYVNYDGMIPVLLEGFKEQQQQIEELKTLVQSLTSGSGETRNKNATAVSLSDKNAIVLNQNVPNPFAESTVVNYNIPTDFTKAQIIFSTNDGKIIKVVDITTKGEGQLNVFANDLSSGMYTYTLVVDGKTIDTKKMVKQ